MKMKVIFFDSIGVKHKEFEAYSITAERDGWRLYTDEKIICLPYNRYEFCQAIII